VVRKFKLEQSPTQIIQINKKKIELSTPRPANIQGVRDGVGADAGRSTMEAAAASSLICGPLFDRRRPQLHRQSLACVSLL